MTSKTLAIALSAALLLPALAFAEVEVVNGEAGMIFMDVPPSAPVREAANKAVEKAELPTVYHAGGRHDQRLHEATVRAQAKGQKMERLPVHAGGRHDSQAHEAAIKADEKRIDDQIRP